jgi:hypothetical protein
MGFRVAAQLTNMPTRKLAVGALVAPAVSQGYSNLMPIIVQKLDWWWLAGFDTFGMAAIVGTVAAMAIAWFVPDAPNVEVVDDNDVENS